MWSPSRHVEGKWQFYSIDHNYDKVLHPLHLIISIYILYIFSDSISIPIYNKYIQIYCMGPFDPKKNDDRNK